MACLVASLPASVSAGGPAPGSYCPFPEKGQKPQCLSGAEARYAEFYRGVETGRWSEADAARLEADLSAGAQHSYDALSSLAYGYYLLARRAAESPATDPALVAQLERWNRLLAQAYHETPPDSSLRGAVREAAQDLHRRAAQVELACSDAEGRPGRCTTTEALLLDLDEARDRSGIRGQIGRMLERVFGGDGS